MYRLLLYVFALFLFALSMPLTAVAGHEAPVKKFSPQEIADRVGSTSGSVAWSPDGKKLAYVGEKDGRVFIYELGSGGVKHLKPGGAWFVTWASENELMVLYDDGGNPALGRADADTLEVRKNSLPERPLSAYLLEDGPAVLLQASKVEKISFGTEVLIKLLRFDIDSGRSKVVYRSSRVLPKRIGISAAGGWIEAGPNPLDSLVMLLEYVYPPAVRSYLKLAVLDYMTGRRTEVSRHQSAGFETQGSWSPDGRRIALTTLEGRLRVLGLDGAMTAVDDSLKGTSPAWNPAGSQIYFGGYVVGSDGSRAERIIGDGAASRAFWAPDGRSMALVERGNLWLLGGFEPKFLEPDTPADEELAEKVRLLKELMMEEFITTGEYVERYNRLMRLKEER